MDAQTQDELAACADLSKSGEYHDQDRLGRYAQFERYYDGEHNTKVLDRAKTYLEASGFRYSDNVCDVVVDSMAEKLSVTGFSIASEKAEGETDPLADAMSVVWEQNRGDEEQGTIHTEALKKGDAIAIIGWDAAREIPTFEFNRPDKMKIVYDPESPRRMLYAVKVWSTCEASSLQNRLGKEIRRMNIYYPDRVEKYFTATEDGDWTEWLDESDRGVWPMPWTNQAGEPRGIPVVHFRNKPKGSPYGRSEIRKVIPQQDGLNKQVLDLFEIMDQQGYPQRWAIGTTTDEVSGLTGGPGVLWSMSKETGKFGQFDAAPLEPVVKTIEHTLTRIAGLSRTPVYQLVMTGNAPSGESLKTAEGPFVSKIRDRHKTFGNAWEDVMRLCLGLMAEMGKIEALPADLRIIVHWDDPETRNEKEHLESLSLKQELGVSKRTLLRELGVEDPDAELARSGAEADESEGRALRQLTRGIGLGMPDVSEEEA